MSESVATVIFNEDRTKILLIKRRDIPVWVLPGGGIEPGEKPEEAAIRESDEETGMQVTLTRKVAYYHPKNRLTRQTHFFECVASGTPQTGPETRDIAFFSLDKLPGKLVPFYKTWIEDALMQSDQVLEKQIRKTSYWTFVWYLLSHPFLVAQFLLTRMGIHINR
ncbi:MAG: NUDIX domain-containing protein [Simkaniaceae bacterium]|nr:NUDIX domain-containing protein [Candidatus Sacchlamyda saccharinae]